MNRLDNLISRQEVLQKMYNRLLFMLSHNIVSVCLTCQENYNALSLVLFFQLYSQKKYTAQHNHNAHSTGQYH